MKYAAYTATRNLYEKMIHSIKSLLLNSDVDKVYLLIEDDKFPVELPKECECINVSKQKIFRVMSPNNCYPWAYMSMMRAALYKMLPDVDVVLSLDADTIIDGDISMLWKYPIDDYYFVATAEPDRCQGDTIYANIGVMMMNLAKLRDGKGDEIVNALNWKRYEILEQDALNELCQGHIGLVPSIYNTCAFTAPCDNPAIVHYAGIRDWTDVPLVQKYMGIPFSEIRKPVRRRRKSEDRGVLRTEGSALND